jgi:hypothetical protein
MEAPEEVRNVHATDYQTSKSAKFNLEQLKNYVINF